MKTVLPYPAPWQVMYAEPSLGPTDGCSALPLAERWLPAAVPGDVHLDLLRAGQIEDPFVGCNTDHCRWMEEMDWWYRSEFTPPPVPPGRRLHLLFEGLDLFASVFLNGRLLGRHANMFTPLRLDITDAVTAGPNRLEVCLGAPAFPPGRAHDPAVRGYGNATRLRVRKAQCCYGWNIAPRLVTVGIWRPVSLVLAPEVEIDSVFVHAVGREGDRVEAEAVVELRRNFGPPRAVEVTLAAAGREFRFTVTCDDAGGRHVLRFPIEQARLWWPHDRGAPDRHPWSATLRADGEVWDRREGRFGLRFAEFVQEPGPDDTCSFQLRLNGVDTFLKGMNWTPADAIFARIDRERYRLLLTAAREANINALRVWGGGLYEHDDFYELCDELGIVVLHDFMFACGCYPQDAEFLDEARREATHVVRRLRNHPCVCGWFGDNENDVVADLSLHASHYKGGPLNRIVLREVVAWHAPTTPYVPTSPFSPTLDDQNSDRQGDCHLWAHGQSYRAPFYTDRRPRMVTEIGHLGMPPREVVESFVSRDRLWPVWHGEYLVHGADDLRLDRQGRYRTLWESIRARGWPEPQNLDELIEMTQRLQAEATEFWVDLYGNQPQCWGIFLWNLADGWPQMSDAYIAYPFHPKPAFAAVREAYGRLRR